MLKSVSFQDCLTDLVAPHPTTAGRAYGKWLADRSKAPVHDFVTNFRHEYLYSVTFDEICQVIGRSGGDHALGNVQTSEQKTEVENFNTPWALQYLFHRCLEDGKKVPLWSEFRAWLVGPAKPDYVAPFMTRFKIAALRARRGSRDYRYWRALRWRVGKAYYSAIRELHLLTALREVHGLPLKYHIFADVVLKFDLWTQAAAIALYIENPTYRDGSAGRKFSLQKVLRGSNHFEVLEVRLPNERKYGKVWIVADEEIAAMADWIRERQARPSR